MPLRGEKRFPGEIVTAVIPSGATGLSAAIPINGFVLTGILMPGTWVTANLTLQASLDGVNFGNVYDDAGNEVTLNAAASRYIKLGGTNLMFGFTHIKLRSGTSGTPVNQTADRSLVLTLQQMS